MLKDEQSSGQGKKCVPVHGIVRDSVLLEFRVAHMEKTVTVGLMKDSGVQ